MTIIKHLTKSLIWLLILAAVATAGFAYWQYSCRYPSTDDAYLQTNMVNIAPQVNGKIINVYVANNMSIKKGQVLFEIDPRPFVIAFNKAHANLQLTKQQIKAAQDAVVAAKAKVDQAQAQLTVAAKSAQRIATLAKQGKASVASDDDAEGKFKVAQAAVVAANSELQQAIQTQGATGDQNAQLRAAKAVLAQASLNLSHTRVIAPADGTVTNFTLRVGDTAAPSQPVFTLIEGNQWWVNANYKETDLSRIHPGQTATIKVDLYPNHLFHGKVQSISRGTGSAFSLLPPENATGNWVKVTQRIPVKIVITDTDAQYPLRVGASSSVKIDTQS